jgi:hypothetical protein
MYISAAFCSSLSILCARQGNEATIWEFVTLSAVLILWTRMMSEEHEKDEKNSNDDPALFTLFFFFLFLF